MILTWKGDVEGLDLQPTWEIESAKIHWVPNFRGDQAATCVLVVSATQEQIAKLVRDYGKENIKVGILGLEALPIRFGQPVWKWTPPKGYEHRMRPAAYTAFELT